LQTCGQNITIIIIKSLFSTSFDSGLIFQAKIQKVLTFKVIEVAKLTNNSDIIVIGNQDKQETA
jgi:hypothetical protein